jgi:hypothetical protein
MTAGLIGVGFVCVFLIGLAAVGVWLEGPRR